MAKYTKFQALKPAVPAAPVAKKPEIELKDAKKPIRFPWDDEVGKLSEKAGGGKPESSALEGIKEGHITQQSTLIGYEIEVESDEDEEVEDEKEGVMQTNIISWKQMFLSLRVI